jgi:hypothetical protein
MPPRQKGVLRVSVWVYPFLHDTHISSPSLQQHYWHMEKILNSNKIIRNENALRTFVKEAKDSYFVMEDFTSTFLYLKNIGAICKSGRTLQWQANKLTSQHMHFLNNETK